MGCSRGAALPGTTGGGTDGLRRRAPQPGSAPPRARLGLLDRRSLGLRRGGGGLRIRAGRGPGGRRRGAASLGNRGAGLPVRRRTWRPLRPAPRHGGIGPAPGRAHRRGGGRRVRRLRSLAGVRARGPRQRCGNALSAGGGRVHTGSHEHPGGAERRQRRRRRDRERRDLRRPGSRRPAAGGNEHGDGLPGYGRARRRIGGPDPGDPARW